MSFGGSRFFYFLPWEAAVSLEHSFHSLKAPPKATVPLLLSLTVPAACQATRAPGRDSTLFQSFSLSHEPHLGDLAGSEEALINICWMNEPGLL